MDNGGWRSPSILGGGRFSWWPATSMESVNGVSTKNCCAKPVFDLRPIWGGCPATKEEVDMPVSAKDMTARLEPELRAQVETRAADLIAQETARRELRRARNRARTNVAKALRITAEDVSRIEKHSDLFFSAFQKSVAATGGKLTLVAEFPDRPNILLRGFSDDQESATPARKLAKRAIGLVQTASQG